MTWQPLLEGSTADAAREVVDEIAAALPAADSWTPDTLNDVSRVSWKAGIAAGAAGKALFYTYLGLERGRREEPSAEAASDLALELLDRATEGVAEVPMGEGLFTGFTGIAWANDHLRGRLYESEGDDANREVDEALLELLETHRPRAEYDLINGLVGIGTYALEGLPRSTALRCLEKVIERLAEKAERPARPEGPAAPGAAWFSPPENLPAFQLEGYPNGFFNLGASHGMAGVVGLLGAACASGVGSARPLLDEAMAWLLRRRQPAGTAFCFPHFFHPDSEPMMSRLAWCYGDPGLAVTLLVAARGAGEPEWEKAAVDTAVSAATRPYELSRIRDAGLCHGSAGIAHLFNRLYQATGEPRLADAARFWFDWTLQFRQSGNGVAGFRSWNTDTAGGESWRSDAGFLEGAAGVGLALLAATSPVEPEWDRLLLAGGRLSPIRSIG